MKLSVVVITHNEAANIRACLTSVAFADQIVVVDSGSTDNTVALAQACGAQVVQTADWPGFGPQKGRALALAQGQWVLSIDADEQVSPALAEQIQAAVMLDEPRGAATQPIQGYELPRLTRFCGQWIHHCGWQPDHVLRLFKREGSRFSDDLVHERVLLPAQAQVGRLSAPLLHDSYPNPAAYWRKLQSYSHAWAVQRHAQGQRASMGRAAASGVAAFVRSYLLQRGFMDGAMGFAVCTMQAQAAFGKYFELYCLSHDPNFESQPPAID
jgi:glycosyltransferase involved in cell wall biosynthesis